MYREWFTRTLSAKMLWSAILSVAIVLLITKNVCAFQTALKDSRASFSLKLNVSNDGDRNLAKPYLLFTYRPDNEKHNSTRVHSFKLIATNKPIQLPVTTSQVVIVTDNFAPGLVCFDKQPNEGELVNKSVTLERGVAMKFRVVDAGKPIKKAIVRPRVQLKVGSEFSWKGRSTNDQGEVEILFPSKFVAGKGYVTARNRTSKHINFASDAGTVEVELNQHACHTVRVLDSDDKPLANAKVCHINSGSKFTNRNRNRPAWKTDANGIFKVYCDPKRPFQPNVIVESGKLRGRFTNVQLNAKKTVTLKMPSPRTIKFNFTGDPNVIKGKTLRVTNGFYDDDRRQYFMWLPYQTNADRSVLTVHGVLDGWLAVSADGVKGNYFWSEKIENKLDEIRIDLNPYKKHTRKFRIAFEHDGKPVQPEGQATFFVRSREKSGEKYCQPLKNGILEVEGEYANNVRDLRIKHHGLKGFSLGTNDDEITVKLTPLEELESGTVEKFVFPVTPAGRISGTIQTAEGEPVTGYFRCNYRHLDKEKRGGPYGFVQSIQGDANGRFELSPAPMGCEVEIRFGELGNRTTKTFVVNSENPIHEPTIRLPETKPASIQISFPTGEPAKGVRVEVYRKDDTSIRFKGRSNKKGVFDIPRLATDTSKKYQYRISSPSGLLKIPAANISAGDALKIKFSKGHRIRGLIANKFGIPVSMMIVEAVDEAGVVVDRAHTNEYGKFQFSRLPDKPVRLRARHIQGDAAKVELTKPFKPDGDKEVKLKAIDNRPLAMSLPTQSSSSLSAISNG